MSVTIVRTVWALPTSSKQVIDLSHLSRHDAWTTLFVGTAIALVCGPYAVNAWNVAYKISINGVLPSHESYRLAVAVARVGFSVFALIGHYMTAGAALVLLR